MDLNFQNLQESFIIPFELYVLKKSKNTCYGFCNIVLLLLICKKATQRGKKMKNTAQKAMYNKHRYCGFGLNFYESFFFK